MIRTVGILLIGALVPMGAVRAASGEDENLRGLIHTPQGNEVVVGEDVPAWVVLETLSRQDVDRVVQSVQDLLAVEPGSYSIRSGYEVHSEVGRQLSLLMEARQKAFSNPGDRSVESLFDEIIGTAEPATVATSASPETLSRLIDLYAALYTRLGVINDYTLLARGPIVTYRSNAAPDTDTPELAQVQLEQARTGVQQSIEQLRITLAD